MKRPKRAARTSFGVRARGRDPTVPCETCGTPTESARLYELAGSAAGVMVTLRGVPCRLCPDDTHPRQQSSNDFETKLSESIFSSETFPMVRAGRFGRVLCVACGKRMREMNERSGEIEAKVWIDGADVTVAASTPVLDCPACGSTQLPRTPELARTLQGAIDHALDRGGLKR